MLPIYKVIDYNENRYLLCKAVMKRARQINFLGDENLEEYKGKTVSLSLKQVFDEEIRFLNPQETRSES
jgi:DNA-directed RNA polymerase subunit K/omega